MGRADSTCDFNSFLLDFIFILRLPYFNPRRVLFLLSNPDSRKCLEMITALLGHWIISNHNVCKASSTVFGSEHVFNG